jgi:hypothetical protein
MDDIECGKKKNSSTFFPFPFLSARMISTGRDTQKPELEGVAGFV